MNTGESFIKGVLSKEYIPIRYCRSVLGVDYSVDKIKRLIKKGVFPTPIMYTPPNHTKARYYFKTDEILEWKENPPQDEPNIVDNREVTNPDESGWRRYAKKEETK